MTTKEVSEIVDETMDVVEETLDVLAGERLPWITRNPKMVASLFSAGTLAVGVTVGYLVAKKILEKKYEEISKQEIAEAREYFQRTEKPASASELASQYEESVRVAESARSREEEDPELAELREITRSYQSDDIEQARASLETVQGRVVDIVEHVETTTVSNVFGDSEDVEFDYELEMRNRTEDYPYVLTNEEFLAGEKDYPQTTLTYYEGDDVLTDERDQPINDTDGTVGNPNLLKFGYGSKDNNIVFVRNDRLTLEFEIVRSQGKYAEQVLGFIQHSRDDRRRPRKFGRNDD